MELAEIVAPASGDAGSALLSGDNVSRLALILSMIAIIVSWRSQRRSVRSADYRNATDYTLKIDELFIAHPALRHQFYAPIDPPPSKREDQLCVEGIAEHMLDSFEAIWDARDTYSADDRKSWRDWVGGMIEDSPILTETYAARQPQHWYPSLERLFAERKVAVRKAADHQAVRPKLASLFQRQRA